MNYYYISGIGFVTPEISGCGQGVKKFNPKPGKLPLIARKDVLDKPYKPFGRMDFFSKIGFAGIYFASKDAGLITAEHMEQSEISDTAIIVSTCFRCLDTDHNYFKTIQLENGKNASPALFAFALPNAFLGEASIYLKTTGQCFAINEDNADGMTILKMAFDILDSRESEIVICGICDTNVPDFMQGVLKDSSNDFAGSLFFALSREERQVNYGTIFEDDNGTVFFNNESIEDLLTLAQMCMDTTKIKDELNL